MTNRIKIFVPTMQEKDVVSARHNEINVVVRFAKRKISRVEQQMLVFC